MDIIFSPYQLSLLFAFSDRDGFVCWFMADIACLVLEHPKKGGRGEQGGLGARHRSCSFTSRLVDSTCVKKGEEALDIELCT